MDSLPSKSSGSTKLNSQEPGATLSMVGAASSSVGSHSTLTSSRSPATSAWISIWNARLTMGLLTHTSIELQDKLAIGVGCQRCFIDLIHVLANCGNEIPCVGRTAKAPQVGHTWDQ